jgi:hypothetical protein
LASVANKQPFQFVKKLNHMKHQFKAKIYEIGINWAVDVPKAISAQMKAEKGYIRIKGQINGFNFIQTLVPVKDAPYRLFVNQLMMKGGKTAIGKEADFTIEQNDTPVEQIYPLPKLLADSLSQHQLEKEFEQLSRFRKKDILKYLSYVKTEETMRKNINKIIAQLSS